MEALLDERRSLVDSIVACRAAEGVPKTIRVVGNYLFVHGHQIPWYRMYSEYSLWQQRSRLLDQELDKDIVLRDGPIVFCTLFNPHRRKDLRLGRWHGTGGKDIRNQFIITKLYYRGDVNRPREDGITLLEFVRKMDQQARVAICVLHRHDYRYLIRDLRHATNQQNLPANEATQVVVPQQLAPVNSARGAAEFMIGPQVTYNNNEINIPGGNLANHTALQHVAQVLQQPYLDHVNSGFNNGLQYPEPTSENVGYDPTLENQASNQANSAIPPNIVMHTMTPRSIDALNTGEHQSRHNCTTDPLHPFHNNTTTCVMAPVEYDTGFRHHPAPSNYVPMNTGFQYCSPQNNNFNPLYPFTNNDSMPVIGSLGNNEMSVPQDPGPSNYVPIQSSSTVSNATREMPRHTQQGTHGDPMTGRNDSLITSFGNSTDLFTQNQNAMDSYLTELDNIEDQYDFDFPGDQFND